VVGEETTVTMGPMAVVVAVEMATAILLVQQINPPCLVQQCTQTLVVLEKAHRTIPLAAAVEQVRQALLQMEMLLVMVAMGNYFLTLPLMATLAVLVAAEAALITHPMRLPLVLAVLAEVVMAGIYKRGLLILVPPILAAAVVEAAEAAAAEVLALAGLVLLACFIRRIHLTT